MCYVFLWMGDMDQAIKSGQRALALASALMDLGLEVVTNFRLGQAHFGLGEYRRAIDVLKQTIEPLQGELIRERFGLPVIPSATCRMWVGMCLANLGEFGAAIAMAEDGLRVAETAGHHYSIANASWGVGGSNLLRGDYDRVIRTLEPSLELCRRGNFAFSFPWISGALGLAYACSGRAAQGLPLIQEAVEQSGALNFMAVHPRTLTWLGEAYLAAGRLVDGLESAQQALSLARAHKQRGVEADALRVLGDVLTTQSPVDPERAAASYREALFLAEELEMRPLVAHCQLGLGKLYRRIGKPQEAREHLVTATRMYREMDMRFWLEQAQAELRGLG
jgi:tetratricopeptide (TPR) repeat protein